MSKYDYHPLILSLKLSLLSWVDKVYPILDSRTKVQGGQEFLI
ncbi:hypothetical protein Mic7113_4072 [Allocoleopsis franciscana PCC 7113]|uniref:Uncharacterized protein n=1 Tax=Allocoleopsis franciscana PCC 7113 TaxID=1173027 RepID=K9WIZ1_9CYAN|nr:hypothetical protein Mic7113_4072 [Allocoleopsis franciscana PCC 7113]